MEVTPVITIDYMNRLQSVATTHTANILVENVTDLATINLIMKFIEFSFDIYNLLSTKGFKNEHLEKLKSITFDTANSVTQEVTKLLHDNSPMYSPAGTPTGMKTTDELFGSYSDDSDEDSEDDDVPDEEDIETIKNLDLESITITKGNLTTNYPVTFLNVLGEKME